MVTHMQCAAGFVLVWLRRWSRRGGMMTPQPC